MIDGRAPWRRPLFPSTQSFRTAAGRWLIPVLSAPFVPVPKELDALGIREFRQILLQPYRLICRVAANTVFILVVADGRRDMQALLERRLLGL